MLTLFDGKTWQHAYLLKNFQVSGSPLDECMAEIATREEDGQRGTETKRDEGRISLLKDDGRGEDTIVLLNCQLYLVRLAIK